MMSTSRVDTALPLPAGRAVETSEGDESSEHHAGDLVEIAVTVVRGRTCTMLLAKYGPAVMAMPGAVRDAALVRDRCVADR
jgi:hypothetical protein